MPFMSQLTGLDNSHLLPPHFPASRREDALFGAMLVVLHHHSVSLNTSGRCRTCHRVTQLQYPAASGGRRWHTAVCPLPDRTYRLQATRPIRSTTQLPRPGCPAHGVPMPTCCWTTRELARAPCNCTHCKASRPTRKKYQSSRVAGLPRPGIFAIQQGDHRQPKSDRHQGIPKTPPKRSH